MTWARFIRTTLLSTAVIAAVGYIGLLWIDPYGTGRLIGMQTTLIPSLSPRLTTAARGRDPDFDAAVLGNSTIQLLEPKRLDAETGLRFVQLSIPGTGPAEQLAILRWFAANHHGTMRAVVIGLDPTWCRPGEAPTGANVQYPFPFWIYGASDLDYAANLPNLKTVNAAADRIKVLLGLKGGTRRDGYNDYDTGHPYDEARVRAHFWDVIAQTEKDVPEEEKETFIVGKPNALGAALDFPAIAALGDMISGFDPSVKAVLVVPPAYAKVLAAMTDENRATLSACRAAARKIAERPNVTLLDFRRDVPLTQEVTNFRDGIHYRKPVARLIEEAIADAIGGRPVRAEVTEAFGGDPAGP